MSDKYLKKTELFSLPGVVGSSFVSTNVKMLTYFDGTIEILGDIQSAGATSGDVLLDLSGNNLLKVLDTYEYAPVSAFGFITDILTDSDMFPVGFDRLTNTVVFYQTVAALINLSIYTKLYPKNLKDQTIHTWGN